MTAEARIRPLRPSDHAPLIAVIDEWWGGRPMAQMLPRLFFDHFATEYEYPGGVRMFSQCPAGKS